MAFSSFLEQVEFMMYGFLFQFWHLLYRVLRSEYMILILKHVCMDAYKPIF